MSRRGFRLFRRLVPVIVVVVAVAAISYVWADRTDPTTVPQQEWHELATNSPAGSMASIPGEHKVMVEPVDGSWVKLAASYMPPPIGQGTSNEVQGTYDPKTGTIRITGKLARAQAGLPPAFQAIFRHALRHEYGHAFADDWRASRKVDEEPFLAFSQSNERTVPRKVPDELKPVVREYAEAPANLYGPSYLTQSFDEYLAESYARFMDGVPIPPDTEAFFKDLAEAK